jgi:hypothetical protein
MAQEERLRKYTPLVGAAAGTSAKFEKFVSHADELGLLFAHLFTIRIGLRHLLVNITVVLRKNVFRGKS